MPETNLDQAETILFLGIGGAGMRGFAWLLKEAGKTIIGIDSNSVVQADPTLADFSIITEDQLAKTIQQADIIVHTDALGTDHQWRGAAALGKAKVYSLYQALGEFAQKYRVISVCGTHGKSSTTAMLAHILVEAGLDPSVSIGAPMPQWSGRNARLGESEWLVLESDEYQNHFHELTPDIVLVTSIDFDHPDFFHSLHEVEKSFSTFLGRLHSGGIVITHQIVVDQHPDVTWPAERLEIVDIAITKHTTLAIPGEHMRVNAALSLAAAQKLGVSQQEALSFLTTWPGLGRRFEQLGTLAGVSVVSDYGHHPAAIKATLLAAREKTRGDILAIFEPHTAGRALHFAQDFGEALALANGVILAPLYQARGEEASEQVATRLAKAVQNQATVVAKPETVAEIPELAAKIAAKYGLIVVFSAGTLDQIFRRHFL